MNSPRPDTSSTAAILIFFSLVMVPFASAEESKPVRMSSEKDGYSHHLMVTNELHCEVTVTVQVTLVNMKADVKLPHVTVVAPRKTQKVMTLESIDIRKRRTFNWQFNWRHGDHKAKHDDSVAYLLPYGGGQTFTLSQGYHGKLTHFGENDYALDWTMPEGTVIRAARGGVVCMMVNDFTTGAADEAKKGQQNYLMIRHDDRTIGLYGHLKKDGFLVKLGQRVKAGDSIAHSGNTGYTTGPHLHFGIYIPVDGHTRRSVPCKFLVGDKVVQLMEGQKYRAR